MVLPNGVPKGMKLVLQERGIDVSKMKADDMQATLQEMHDFKYEKNLKVCCFVIITKDFSFPNSTVN